MTIARTYINYYPLRSMIKKTTERREGVKIRIPLVNKLSIVT